jgi:hypothetical protein
MTLLSVSVQEAPMKNNCTAISVLLLGIVCATFLHAQRGNPYEFATLDGIWDRTEVLDHNFSFIKLPATEQPVVVRKREAIFEIVKNSRVFIPFKGIAIRARKEVVGRADNAGNPNSTDPVELLVHMTIGKFIRIAKTGRIEPFYTEMPWIEISTNSLGKTPPAWDANKFWYEGLHDEQGREFYLEPHVTAKTDGGLNIFRLDAWFEEVVVTNGRPLWIPATSEQFLRAMINYAREMRLKENENSRTSRAPLIPEDRSAPMQFITGYEKELAALSPAERQQPAYYLRINDQPFFSGLAKAGTRWARLVVTPNPDYLNRSLPRSAIQLISCLYNYNQPYGSDEPEKPDVSLKTLNNLARHLEYEKLAAFIEK